MTDHDQCTTEIPEALRVRAETLGLVVEVLGPEGLAEGIDCGPFVLRDHGGYNVWEGGLPAEGIAEALDRYEREKLLDEKDVAEAWKGFGEGWAADAFSRWTKQQTNIREPS